MSSSLSLLKRTLTALNCPVKPTCGTSRYDKKHSLNGLASQRSSQCYNAIKKRRLLRQGKGRSQTRCSNPQRATIATDQIYDSKDEPSLGHCINHLETIIQLLKEQKVQSEQEMKPKDSMNRKRKQSKVSESSLVKQKVKQTAPTIRKQIEKRYRTISHQQNTQKRSNYCSIQRQQSLILKFNKQQNGLQNNSSSRKLLLAKVINQTKRQSKVLKLKQVRDKYKNLSKSKSIEQHELVSNKKILPKNTSTQSNKRYGRKLLRVCSIGNYPMGQPYRKTDSQLKNQSKNQLEQVEVKKQKIQKLQIMKFQDKTSRKNSIKVSKKDSPTFSDKSKLFLNDCSSIDQKAHARSSNSFFSEMPSYFKDGQKQNKLFEQKLTPSKMKSSKTSAIKPKTQEKILDLVAMDSNEIKSIFKSKQRRRQLEKWKKNFPQGFFEGAAI